MGIKYKTPQGWVELAGMKPIDISQSPAGITINGTELQDATASQDGLMTKEKVKQIEDIGITASMSGQTLNMEVNGKSASVEIPSGGVLECGYHLKPSKTTADSWNIYNYDDVNSMLTISHKLPTAVSSKLNAGAINKEGVIEYNPKNTPFPLPVYAELWYDSYAYKLTDVKLISCWMSLTDGKIVFDFVGPKASLTKAEDLYAFVTLPITP